MFSDSITSNGSIPSAPKDFNKKKRANRSAKLKQCKLDARREQWLSQGTVKSKAYKEQSAGARASPPPPLCNKNSRRKNSLEDLEMRRGGVGIGEEENESGSIHHDFDSYSPSNSPSSSSVLDGTDSGANFTASSSSSSSSGSSGGCCSGSITEEEEEGDDDCLDDWEAMADALAASDDDKQQNKSDSPCLEAEESSQVHDPTSPLSANMDNLGSTRENLNQACPRMAPPTSRLAPGNSRAWRPDDACRPHSLPNLSKQMSVPNASRHYGQEGPPSSAVNVPSSCPICTEDLDFTDTSFLPCSCGFRLCLFCHKKILEQDGRCPNCRKLYEHDPVQVEASVHGGSLTLRLARSCSMFERS